MDPQKPADNSARRKEWDKDSGVMMRVTETGDGDGKEGGNQKKGEAA